MAHPGTSGAGLMQPSRGAMATFLDLVERVGNRLPDQSTIFILLAIVVLVASGICAASGVAITHPTSGKSVQAYNLLTREGVQWIFSSAVTNFTGFAPLGTVLVAMIGVGVAERVGLFAVLLKGVLAATPRAAITPMIIFAGILSHLAADAGYVILPPLAAMIYASLGRNPIAGVAAAFAGVGAGFSASVLPCALDPLLAGLTEPAAQVIDASYRVHALVNYYFMAASTVMLTLVGWFVSVRIVEPRLGPWSPAASPTQSPAITDAALEPVTAAERRGLWAAVCALAAFGIGVYVLVAPRGAILRDAAVDASSIRSFEPFFRSLVPLIMLMFILPGLVFGLVTRQIRSDSDVSRMMSVTMAGMGTYVVMAFFAGQFIAWFNKSNLGLIIAVEGGRLLGSIGLTGLPLMIAFVVFVATFNILISSASAKWAILAPIFVPMFMQLGTSPETTQCFYRVGDSCTNAITPLNVYVPILLAVCQRFVPTAGLGTLIAAMIPYSVVFLICWTAMAAIWISAGWDIGPGAPLTYPN